MNNKTVFVLGAGFSKEASFPLTKEFTDRTEIKKFRKTLEKSEQERLDRVTEYFFNRIDEGYCRDDIESVLNHIAVADYLEMEATTQSDDTYLSSQIFKDLLWFLTKMLKSRAKNSIPSEYEKFVKYAYENDCSIISFNYDMVIEEVLRKLDVGCDYCFSTEPIDDSLSLMKMHGSVNWTLCSKCGNTVVFSDYEAPNVLEGKSQCTVCHNNSLETIIIPPILYKDTFYKHSQYESLIRRLWGFANDYLVEAKNVVFIGFSMAGTDAYAQELFKFSSNMNKDIKYYLVTRPKSKEDIERLEKRYKEVLVGNEIRIIEESFCEYANKLELSRKT